MVSPEELSRPHPYFLVSNTSRVEQTSSLPKLPDTMLQQIFSLLVDQPIPTSANKTTCTDLDILNLLSLMRTCSTLRHFHLPPRIWRLITSDSVKRFSLTLLDRWKANPTGVGSANQIWIALDESFIEPVTKEFEILEASAESPERIGARDIWAWWSFDEGWRSRRRVWYCAVQGCATARDADWW
jgi:hypothetical protein